MTETHFIYLMLTAMVVLFIIILWLFRRRDRRRDLNRLAAMKWIVEWEKREAELLDRLTYPRKQLVRNDDETCFVECMLCGGCGPVESELHAETCVFANANVAVILKGF